MRLKLYLCPSRFVGLFLLLVGCLSLEAREDLDARFSVESNLEGSVSLPGRVGLEYSLLVSTDLVEWTRLGESIAGAGEGLELSVGKLGASVFFRVRAVVADSFSSRMTFIDYPVHVYVPDGYENTDRNYPIIYATDGQWISGGFSAAIKAKGKQIILVTIEQGPGDRRAIDYLLPGATNYFAFLTKELIPAIESVYRVDGNERSLCGTSYGGLLVGLALLMDDIEKPVFKNYLSFDGSFYTHQLETNALESVRFAASQEMNVTLYLTSATAYPNNDSWVTRFKNQIESRSYGGLQVIRKSYSVPHNDVAEPSFDGVLDELF